MSNVNIVRVYHPSGTLFDAYRSFSGAHGKAVYFQSEAFIRLIEKWPEADWVLLLAVRDEGLTDPGARSPSYRPGDIFKDRPRNGTSDVASKPGSKSVEPTKIAASLLAVVIREPTPASPLLRPFDGLYRKLTSRTMVYGGPLLGDATRLQQELVTKSLLNALHQQVRKRSLFTQFCNSCDLTDFIPLFREMGYEYRERLNLLADTTSYKEAWQNIPASLQRQLLLSIENGATIINNPDKEQLIAFYNILKDRYDKKVKKPLPGKDFFFALSELSDDDGSAAPGKAPEGEAGRPSPNSKLLLVAHGGRIIGGSACVLMPGSCIHEWYVGGLDSEYKNRQVFPGAMATWAAIEYATGNNIPTFDFMGHGEPDEHSGVKDFKEKFGGRRVNHGRFFRVNSAAWYGALRLFPGLHIA